MDTSNLVIAFSLTLFAGLSTGIGSALAFFAKKTNTRFLSAALGFSAGVMIYVSMIELFSEANSSLAEIYGEQTGSIMTVASFFGGILLIAIIDKLVPSFENPHELRCIEEMDKPAANAEHVDQRLLRTGLFSAFAIAIHNFPEGLATFAAALKDPQIGVSIAIAIAIHNIPEGIAVSIPVFYATNNRKKAFAYSFLSGLSEPLGAIIGYVILFSFYNEAMFGILFAMIAGIMVFISIDELLPAAREYGEHHISIYGLIAGMIVMAVSLLVFI